MPWKDSKSEAILDEHERELQSHARGGGSGWSVMAYALLGVGILVISGVLLYLFLGQSMSEDSEQIRMLAERLSVMESRLAAVEASSPGVDDAAAQRSKRVELFMGRFENLETTVARRMSDLALRLEALESGSRPQPARTPPPAGAAPSEKPAAAPAATHVVTKGDTLYSISRKYGLTVAALLTLNGMPPGAVIQPGQSLKVAPAPR